MKIFSYLLLLSLLTFSFKPSFSQLIVGTVATPEELAGSLVGSGVTITNVTLNCPNGGWGSFDGTNSNIGIDSGIILACGSINNAVGPNFSGGITTAFGTTGDQDLTDLAGQETHDACVLEFDLAASSDSINFSYVFASDEYTEYVNSINDIFAFFISGPGITGEQNIALVPGTTDPVAINTVNCLNGSLYYICNDPLNSQCDATYNCPTDASLTTIEYDGFTTVLTAVANVQPCQTYHLKLAIADASDEILDSGVFIKASSLSTAASSVTVSTPYNDPITNLPAVVEGCFSATVEVQTCNPSTDSVALHYTISGTATNGTDYNQIADSIFIPPGLSSANLIIDPLVDGVSESSETVTLYFYSTSPSNPYDSVTILILDSLIAIASLDTVICVGQSASLTVNDAASWIWTPSLGLSCTTCQNPIATPTVTTTYTVELTVASCTATDEVTITVNNPIPVNAGADAELCIGESVQLNATNANSYTWTPSTDLSSTTIANPTASPTVTTTYYVTGTNGCYTTQDTITVVVHPLPDVMVSPGVTVCPGTPVDLLASGGVTYEWFPSDGLIDASIQNTIATVNETTIFTVLVTDEFGCMDSGTVTVTVFDIPDITISNDTTIYLGNSYPIIVTGGAGYQWSPATGLNATNTPDPIATPLVTTTYTVTITTPEGCIVVDSVTITVKFDALVEVASGFSPNSDGTNDILHVLARGIFNLDHFYIFNRWGEIVFQSNDVSIGWDGTYKGEPQEVGVYIYLVEGRDAVGTKINRQGSVSLLR